MSEPTDCRRMVFVELPVGFKSANRSPDIDQTAVVLSGSLRIMAREDDVRHLEAGQIFSVPKAAGSRHMLEVVGEVPVRLMVLQA
ncbi:MAG: cupin domain-containing protein [Paracoccaceae bacterium]|nr:cupin domain-containing protein [Paracoccaceae bacterium]